MPQIKFEDLKLSKELLKAINDMGFEEATPIQAQTIPNILEGKDLIGQAQTGTGKTAAFGLPILDMIIPVIKAAGCDFMSYKRTCYSGSRRNKGTFKIQGKHQSPACLRRTANRKADKCSKKGTDSYRHPGRVLDHMRRRTLKCMMLRYQY